MEKKGNITLYTGDGNGPLKIVDCVISSVLSPDLTFVGRPVRWATGVRPSTHHPVKIVTTLPYIVQTDPEKPEETNEKAAALANDAGSPRVGVGFDIQRCGRALWRWVLSAVPLFV